MKDYLRLSIGLCLLVLWSSGCKEGNTFHIIEGETWGTYYRVTLSDKSAVHQQNIESILAEFDAVLSTYVDHSVISKFNKSKEGISLSTDQDKYWKPVWEKSIELHESTGGYLDATVLPLLNYWGFGNTGLKDDKSIDSTVVSALRTLLVMDKLSRRVQEGQVNYNKPTSKVKLDFSALAKGYGIDVIAEYFDNSGVEHYLIDIGGEMRSKGTNSQGKPWTIAINKPYPGAKYTTQELILYLKDKSIATSGNYREMYTVEGRVYGHILDPISGYPKGSEILSVSIIADDCMTADGLATACIAAGLDKAKNIIQKHNVAACLIIDEDGDDNLDKIYLNGFEEYVIADTGRK